MKSIFKFELFSTIFIFILGTLLHFTYNLSSNNSLVGIFSSVNESTWEHLKLIFFPMLITGIVGAIYFKEIYPNYLCVKTRGIIISMLFMVIFYYTYKGILGYDITFLNIGSFFISALICEYYTYKNINNIICNNKLAIIILGILFLLFLIFTFYPPNINLFIDPISCIYGIS